ncbi:hypothetical protein ACFVAV_33850 [Nocardia sp. NPDC057663]|uniref:hypothetical protein n=1 Tax=Nocardia sp. NPDC057663 TaxID=3346201 RepID=UPI0036723954
MTGAEAQRAAWLRRWLSERTSISGEIHVERTDFGHSNIASLVSDRAGTAGSVFLLRSGLGSDIEW